MTARDDDTRRAVAPRLTTTPAIPVASAPTTRQRRSVTTTSPSS